MSMPKVSTWWHIARGRGARWGVVVLWVLGAVLSYSALRDLAVMLGFSDKLANLWPLVIDLAVWVGSMNALEAGEQHRRTIERYAWVLVALYSVATVAGNALVSSAEPVDPRMVRALGGACAHAVSVIAHAAPALTMVLFAHLAGLLMGEEERVRNIDEACQRVGDVAKEPPAVRTVDLTTDTTCDKVPVPCPSVASAEVRRQLPPAWPSLDDRPHGLSGPDTTGLISPWRRAAERDSATSTSGPMSAAEAKQVFSAWFVRPRLPVVGCRLPTSIGPAAAPRGMRVVSWLRRSLTSMARPPSGGRVIDGHLCQLKDSPDNAASQL
jgi:Protein of unknown function (DUF2637)